MVVPHLLPRGHQGAESRRRSCWREADRRGIPVLATPLESTPFIKAALRLPGGAAGPAAAPALGAPRRVRPRGPHRRGERHRQVGVRARPHRPRPPPHRRRRGGDQAHRRRAHRRVAGAHALPHGAARPRGPEHQGPLRRVVGAPLRSASSWWSASSAGRRGREYDRLGLRDEMFTILGVAVPLVRMPVAPGRNIAILVEVASRNRLLKDAGLRRGAAAWRSGWTR